MTTALDVLVIESDRGAAHDATHELEAAGHRVHTCHDGPGPFPCVGLVDPKACPLAKGIDVAVLAHRGGSLSPTIREMGAACAIRSQVPVVGMHSPAEDPFESWIVAHAERGNVVDACVWAAALADDALAHEVRAQVARPLRANGIDPDDIVVRISHRGVTGLVVRVEAPGLSSARVAQAVGVRVLDAVRASGRTYGDVSVQVQDTHDTKR